MSATFLYVLFIAGALKHATQMQLEGRIAYTEDPGRVKDARNNIQKKVDSMTRQCISFQYNYIVL